NVVVETGRGLAAHARILGVALGGGTAKRTGARGGRIVSALDYESQLCFYSCEGQDCARGQSLSVAETSAPVRLAVEHHHAEGFGPGQSKCVVHWIQTDS